MVVLSEYHSYSLQCFMTKQGFILKTTLIKCGYFSVFLTWRYLAYHIKKLVHYPPMHSLVIHNTCYF